jgi:NAD(P)-dependent dehydrogenase (short-subunit alcohol dehydrogenase family)
MQGNEKSMAGTTCMVTGSTSGIGQVVAFRLAELGAKVIVVGRNKEKSTATVDRIKEQSGNQQVEYLLADLSVLEEVRGLANQFKKRYSRLDVLINNAGVSMSKRKETGDGFEMTFAVNHLSHFLLTNLLLDTIRASAPARVINVSSSLHSRTGIDFEDLQKTKRYIGMTAYGQSKLANILFTYELARRLNSSGVTVNAVHPGLVATNLSSNSSGLSRAVWRVISLFAKSPEEGAQTIIYLATSLEVEHITGNYFVNLKPVKSSAASYDENVARRLWSVSAESPATSA